MQDTAEGRELSQDSIAGNGHPTPGPAADGVRGRDLLIGVPILWAAELALGIALVLWTGIPLVLEDHPIPILVLTLTAGAVTVLVTWLLVCLKYRKKFTEGFLIVRPGRKALLVSVLIGIGLSLVAAALSGAYSTGEHLFVKLMSTPAGLASLGILVLMLPFVEELYYRGFIYSAIERQMGAPLATSAVIIWFAAAHSLQSLDDPIAIPIVCAVGAILTVQRRVTGSLTASLVTHLTYNACLLLFTLLALA